MGDWRILENADGNGVSRKVTEAMAVPGGTLFRTMVWGHGSHGKGLPPSVALVFVPTPAPAGAAGAQRDLSARDTEC